MSLCNEWKIANTKKLYIIRSMHGYNQIQTSALLLINMLTNNSACFGIVCI
jgi:hypothetical protein